MDNEDKRRHQREDVFTAIMISPNGHEQRTAVFDLSESGARLGIPADFERHVGAALRLFFPLENEPTLILKAQLVRVAVDHLGVQFAPFQEQGIHHLMAELAGTR